MWVGGWKGKQAFPFAHMYTKSLFFFPLHFYRRVDFDLLGLVWFGFGMPWQAMGVDGVDGLTACLLACLLACLPALGAFMIPALLQWTRGLID
ncbi:hypothetical protein BS50DRAFT_4354 [Corynespora cassiicola Philippines]|uniref:Uncharacterized protein n=1 Tax=Corynespora cassiicola Philippines TaxID=1448308 RepID=A0A2T2P9A6_CORCC|nr:hypothetical protein BS50DRAFT_4354 [Corynespora cassiicola Philippines]